MRLIFSLPVVVCLLTLFCFKIPFTHGLVTTDEILDDSVDTEDENNLFYENQKTEDEMQDIANDQADTGDVIEAPSEQEESTGQADTSSEEDVEVR